MKTNFSLLFYVKKQRNYTSGDAPIYLRITVDGKRSEITTNRECNPEKWNSKSGRLIGTKQEIKSFNSFLDNLQAKVYEAHRYLSENEKLITSETLKGRILGKVEKARMLIDIFRDHNNKKIPLSKFSEQVELLPEIFLKTSDGQITTIEELMKNGYISFC